MHNNMEESAYLFENFNRKIEADSHIAIIRVKKGQGYFNKMHIILAGESFNFMCSSSDVGIKEI